MIHPSRATDGALSPYFTMKHLLAALSVLGAAVTIANRIQRLRLDLDLDRSPMPTNDQKLRCARCQRTASRVCPARDCRNNLCASCTCPDCAVWTLLAQRQPFDGPSAADPNVGIPKTSVRPCTKRARKS